MIQLADKTKVYIPFVEYAEALISLVAKNHNIQNTTRKINYNTQMPREKYKRKERQNIYVAKCNHLHPWEREVEFIINIKKAHSKISQPFSA